ncbi:MAG TPA: hypothetical protein DF984_04085 [Anaerolineaceae bacterium]|nr:hypothetical protein [Anaerolineaceae bacterium]
MKLEQKKFFPKTGNLWHFYKTRICLFVLIFIFLAYAVFLALFLEEGIVPDESYRYEVSKHFSKTWGVPDNYSASYTSGIDIPNNPYLGYWIFGRIINIFDLVAPSATPRQQLVFLRIVNAIISTGTIFFCYLLAKESIPHKWWRLLPAFLLSNTLMFVFLSGGVSYDNLVNLVCFASIYYLVRVLKGKDFLSNSLGWLINILMGSLIKYSILPLTLVMGIVWLAYLIKNRKVIKILAPKGIGNIFLFCLFCLIFILNLSLYGGNLLKFHSLIPSCRDTFTTEICKTSSYAIREQELALPEKLTLVQAIKQGNPEPIRYFFDEWIREMLKRIYGIMGHKNYFPINIAYFHVAFFWVLLLSFRYIKKPDFTKISLAAIFVFYMLVLVIMNYNTELAYGFNKYVALQGRYLFPVIGIGYVLITHILTKTTNKLLRWGTTAALIALFLYSGPIRFIWYYGTVFADWFI